MSLKIQEGSVQIRPDHMPLTRHSIEIPIMSIITKNDALLFINLRFRFLIHDVHGLADRLKISRSNKDVQETR